MAMAERAQVAAASRGTFHHLLRGGSSSSQAGGVGSSTSSQSYVGSGHGKTESGLNKSQSVPLGLILVVLLVRSQS